MADGVHAAVYPMQPTTGQPMTNRTGAELEGHKLRARDDSVLALCKLGDHGVDPTRLRFCPYDGHKCSLVLHMPIVARQLWRRGPGL